MVRVGNGKGVRIPKRLRDEAGLNDKVAMTVQGRAIVIRPAGYKVRQGWAEQYDKALRENPEPETAWPDDMGTVYDKEWTW